MGGSPLTGKWRFRVDFSEDVSLKTAKKIKIYTESGEGATPFDFEDSTKWNVRSGAGTEGVAKQYIYEPINSEGDVSIEEGAKAATNTHESITLTEFELSKIDDMREAILAAPKTAPFNIGSLNSLPYTASLANATVDETNTNGNSSYFSQAGLGIKTYLSDRFNNWLSTEWIDGEGGIADITSVDVSDGMLKMDALILAKKSTT